MSMVQVSPSHPGSQLQLKEPIEMLASTDDSLQSAAFCPHGSCRHSSMSITHAENGSAIHPTAQEQLYTLYGTTAVALPTELSVESLQFPF